MPTILHTEASLGLGGQELRIVAESRWLRDHGWGALIACQPESRLFAEARTAGVDAVAVRMRNAVDLGALRSEEHTSELQSQSNLVCRLLLEKKKEQISEYRSVD